MKKKYEEYEEIAVYLYEKGLLSKTQASDLINKSLYDFNEILLKYGYPSSGSSDKTRNDIYMKNIFLS